MIGAHGKMLRFLLVGIPSYKITLNLMMVVLIKTDFNKGLL